MSQVVLHLGEQYIEEDLEYYFSGERDKNNQVRPDETIYSMTPFSDHIDMDFTDGNVGNFFYPILPAALDRIYIGISVSLFANYWGASFLLELLKHLKPGGAVIIPVYPEGQAAEKDFWSRSFLENIFLSRERWTGFSNITAENDGVMSLRVGRKWPTSMPSSIEWFFKERSNLLLAGLQSGYSGGELTTHIKNTFTPLCKTIWNEYSASAVTERIIIDALGKNKKCSLGHVGRDYGMLANDVILSSFLQVQNGETWHIGERDEMLANSIEKYFSAHTAGKHSTHFASNHDVAFSQSHDVIVMSQLFEDIGEQAYQSLLSQAWSKLNPNGILIVREDLSGKGNAASSLEAMMSALSSDVSHYSAIAACKIKPGVEISQYSLAVEENLRQEASRKDNIFRVIQKSS